MTRRGWYYPILLLALVVAGPGQGDTFKLADGSTVTGEPLSFTAEDVLVRVGGSQYERIPWAKLSQETLKELVQNPKAANYAEPFIELTPEEHAERTGLIVKDVPRLVRPGDGSLFGMIASPIGFFFLVLVIGASAFAGYEVAFFRNRPPGLVSGVSAVVPILGPIIFLAMPTRQYTPEDIGLVSSRDSGEPEEFELPAEEAPAEELAAETGAVLPPKSSFRRGEFTLNRRFIETRFAGFMRPVRPPEFADMVLEVKSSRGDFVTNRITRVTQNEVVLQVARGGATADETIPFLEISEVVLRHRDDGA